MATSCDDNDSRTAASPSTESITVLNGEDVVATYEDQAEAARKASELAGFEIFPVEELPAGFSVDAIKVLSSSAPFSRAEVFVLSDRGGFLLEQINVRLDPPPTATPLTGPGNGDYFRQISGPGVHYRLVAANRSFSILTPQESALTDD